MAGVDIDERRARIVMSRVAEPGDPDACRLVREHSAMELVERLHGRHDSDSKLADWADRAAGADADVLLERGEVVGARYVCPGDADWPHQLDDLETTEAGSGDRRGGSPFGLWVRGKVSLAPLTLRAVAIVGARSSTAYGEHVAGDLGMECSERGYTVVSGGAYGIDAAAHRGALAADVPTLAVLAGGIDRLYPAGNIPLLERVQGSGLIIAEAAPGCSPSKSRFLVRNRLIAALTLGTVVVEAALRSGSLNTARWALDLNRWVMGVPGPVTSRMSAGVNELLRHPETTVVTDAAEVVEHLSPIGTALAPVKSGPVAPCDQLDLRSRRVLEAVPVSRPVPTHAIARTAGLQRDDVATRLVALQRQGLVVGIDGSWRLAR